MIRILASYVTVLGIAFCSNANNDEIIIKDSTSNNQEQMAVVKHGVWKHKWFAWYGNGEKKSIEKVSWFQVHRLKAWDEAGKLIIKEKNSPYGWDRGKRKKWVNTYYDNGNIKSSKYLYTKDRKLKLKWLKLYDESGKIVKEERRKPK